MSIFSFDMTNAMALEEVPGPASKIDADSTPVNSSKVTAWREGMAGRITSILEAQGVDDQDLTEANTRVAQRLIRTFVAHKVLQAHGDPQAAEYRDEYLLGLADLRSLDEVQDSEDEATPIATNVDVNNPKTKRFTSFNAVTGDGWTDW